MKRQFKQVEHNFIIPKTDDEWKNFHKINEDNMQKAYHSDEGYYKDGNKIYIAGTRGFQDFMDWPKIPLGMVSHSKIYEHAENTFEKIKIYCFWSLLWRSCCFRITTKSSTNNTYHTSCSGFSKK